MEEIKSSIRPYDASQQYKQSLTDGTEYYRITVHSVFKTAGSTNTDALFRVDHVFPNHRSDLMNGKWYAFLEGFYSLGMPTQEEKGNLKVCLPDLIQNSHDFVMTAQGKCQVDDTLEVFPIPTVFHQDNSIDIMPLTFTQHFTSSSVGRQINPTSLISGDLRLVLRNIDHSALAVSTAGAPDMAAGEKWTATILFVHKT